MLKYSAARDTIVHEKNPSPSKRQREENLQKTRMYGRLQRGECGRWMRLTKCDVGSSEGCSCVRETRIAHTHALHTLPTNGGRATGKVVQALRALVDAWELSMSQQTTPCPSAHAGCSQERHQAQSPRRKGTRHHRPVPALCCVAMLRSSMRRSSLLLRPLRRRKAVKVELG